MRFSLFSGAVVMAAAIANMANGVVIKDSGHELNGDNVLNMLS